jgi:glucokinase
VLGIDLGGSKILSAVVDSSGKIIGSNYRPTQAVQGVNAVINNILKSAQAAVIKASISFERISAVGLAAPGISNPESGIVYRSPNLPGWRNVPFESIIAEKLQKKTFLINDANAAALGEMYYGSAVGYRNFIYITISTGIGGGIVIDGNLYSGAKGMAGEIGHMVIEPNGLPCNCGGSGCWELYASGSAIARRAREEIQNGKKTQLVEMSDNSHEKIEASLVKKAAENGDQLSIKLITETARYLGIGFGNLINIFNPQLIVIGGGLTKMGDMLLKPAISEAKRRSYPEIFKAVKFSMAKLGDYSGVIGAAVNARNKTI